MNSSQINELFLSNKRLNELVFDLNTRLTNKIDTLEKKVDLLSNRIENIYVQNNELINMFHMKNNEEFTKKLNIINENMDKLNNLSSFVCTELNLIGNNLNNNKKNEENNQGNIQRNNQDRGDNNLIDIDILDNNQFNLQFPNKGVSNINNMSSNFVNNINTL